MNSPAPVALPDHDRLAAEFDRYLSLVEPVGWAVLEHLPALTEDARALDVACGTGEPGLTLARRAPGVQLLGVDAAAGMVEVARAKAAREGLSNVRFEVMAAEALGCADGSMRDLHATHRERKVTPGRVPFVRRDPLCPAGTAAVASDRGRQIKSAVTARAVVAAPAIAHRAAKKFSATRRSYPAKPATTAEKRADKRTRPSA